MVKRIVVKDSDSVAPTVFTGRESRRVISPERDKSLKMSLHKLHNFEKGVSYEVRYPQNDEILYILEGEGCIRDGEQSLPFKTGSCVFIPADTPYRICNPTELRMLAILSPPRYRDDWKNRPDLVQLEPAEESAELTERHIRRLLRVDMCNRTATLSEVPEKYVLLGGRALTSQLVSDEVPPNCEPLGPDNKLVIAPGLLSGTSAPSSGRLSVGSKSPLTGTIKESNAGGITSQKLANLGIKAIVIEGKPSGEELYLLRITLDGASILPAGDLAGKGTYEVTDICRQRYGDKVAVMTIGPAGEMLMSAAGIANSDSEGNSSRYAARGGLGAVMGSKRIKAIVIDSPTTFDAAVRDPNRFKSAAQRLAKMFKDHSVTGQGLPSFGSNVLMSVINEAGALPTRNFRYGRFPQVAEVSGQKLAEVASARGGKMGHACHPGCVIRCSNVYPMPSGEVCSPIEYETAWAFGPNLEIGDLDTIARMNRICNDVGLDTIETGCTLGVLMEAGVLEFGDGTGAIKLLEEVKLGTPLARIVGNGASLAGKAFGVARVPTAKGQGFSGYDPRACKGMGVTYATGTMGADHTSGYAVASNILKVGGDVDALGTEGQVDLSRNFQVATAAFDSTGLCLFASFPMLENPEVLPTILELINAQYGCNLTQEDFVKLGQQVLQTEREFNRRAGFGQVHDRVPAFFVNEPLPPHNTTFDISGEALDQVFTFEVCETSPQ